MARTTDNLGLTIPDMGEPAEQWVGEVADTFERLDAHDHTVGRKITQDAIALTDDLSASDQSITNVASVGLKPNTTTPGAARLYSNNGDLYYNNGGGDPIRLTAGISPVGGGGTSIYGDYVASNATLRYTNAQSSYTFRTGAGALAVVQAGDVQATSVRLASSSSGVAVTGSLFVLDGDLFFRTPAGALQITEGAILREPKGIQGDYANAAASASYAQNTKTYSFRDDSNAVATLRASTLLADTAPKAAVASSRTFYTSGVEMSLPPSAVDAALYGGTGDPVFSGPGGTIPALNPLSPQGRLALHLPPTGTLTGGSVTIQLWAAQGEAQPTNSYYFQTAGIRVYDLVTGVTQEIGLDDAVQAVTPDRKYTLSLFPANLPITATTAAFAYFSYPWEGNERLSARIAILNVALQVTTDSLTTTRR